MRSSRLSTSRYSTLHAVRTNGLRVRSSLSSSRLLNSTEHMFLLRGQAEVRNVKPLRPTDAREFLHCDFRRAKR